MKNTLKTIMQAVKIAIDKVEDKIQKSRELLYELTEEDFMIETKEELYFGSSREDYIWYELASVPEEGTLLKFSINNAEPIKFRYYSDSSDINHFSFEYGEYRVDITGCDFKIYGENLDGIEPELIKMESQRNEGDDCEACTAINLNEFEAEELIEAELECEMSLIINDTETGDKGKIIYKSYMDTAISTYNDISKSRVCYRGDLWNDFMEWNAYVGIMLSKNFDCFDCVPSSGVNQLFIRTMWCEVEYIRIYKVTK